MKFASALKKTLETFLAISIAATPMELGQREYQEPTTIQPRYGQAELYPNKVEWIDGKPVVETSKYLIGDNILGLCNTYSGFIQIREGIRGRDRERVLEHELGHREHPMRSEAENRRKTYTEEPEMHLMVSYVG